jgi:1,4-dihydroxy-2-naphthoyl-CoA synthase
MINKVVPQEKLYEEVQAWCETLLDRSPTYLEVSKVSANVWFDMLMPSFEMVKQTMIHMAGNPEQTEGASAFMEKRKPNFRQFRK